MRAIGIDLGTTNSVVAYVNAKGEPEVIPSREGGRTVPSVVAWDNDGNTLVGQPAVDQEAINPALTIRSVKRHMGERAWRFRAFDKDYTAEEISAEILKKLKSDAEAFLGQPVTEAVITVPAYFDSDQRQATRTAGELAGLKVLLVINEPTAAALAYGLDRKKNETVLVYDLGGGTFDVTILKITDDGVFEVKSTSGDTQLGGDDFDAALEKLILAHGGVTVYPEGTEPPILSEGIAVEYTASVHARLREAAESAKKQLSAAPTARVTIPYFTFHNGAPFTLQATVSRTEFEQAIEPYVLRTKECVEQALKDAGMRATDVHEVVFVGGSTRVPRIAEAVKEWTGRNPNRSINPDEAVALGAAVQASVLQGDTTHEVFLIDVIPLSLGIETEGGVMTTMIKRNHPIPTEFTEEFTTATDGQLKVEIKVYQGERALCKDNKFLGNFSLPIPPAPRGVPQILVTFDVDASGILSVHAKDKVTGEERQVTMTGSGSLTQDEVSRMVKEAEQFAAEDKALRLIHDLQSVVIEHLMQAESLLRSARHLMPEDVVEEIEELVRALDDAKASQNVELLSALCRSATDDIKMASKYAYEEAERVVQK